jgi:hypothetical protein
MSGCFINSIAVIFDLAREYPARAAASAWPMFGLAVNSRTKARIFFVSPTYYSVVGLLLQPTVSELLYPCQIAIMLGSLFSVPFLLCRERALVRRPISSLLHSSFSFFQKMFVDDFGNVF